ncbi:MAG: citrate lyase subunit alpha [Synergistaceae bacterium]|jgi:citrate lyase subunit alpha/citrate CoA-transferase
MDELVSRAHKMSGPTDPVATEDRIIGVVEWRDGTVIDVVRQLKTK